MLNAVFVKMSKYNVCGSYYSGTRSLQCDFVNPVTHLRNDVSKVK